MQSTTRIALLLRTRPLMIFVCLGLGMAVASLVAVSRSSVSRAAEAPRHGAGTLHSDVIPGCGGAITPTLSAEVIDPCGAIDMEVVVTPPECTRCTRLHVVFIQVGRANAAGWMKEESLSALDGLASARDELALDIRVGVVAYDTVTATVTLEMTDDFASVREALSAPVRGDAHGGHVERAARLAVEMLSWERAYARSEGAVTCDSSMLFASTGAFNIAGGLLLENAAGIIRRAEIPMNVGCPELSSSNCIFTRGLASDVRRYSEPPDEGKLNLALRSDAESAAAPKDIEAYSATLTQRLPDGLKFVEGSGVPPPSVSTGDDGVDLEWEWARTLRSSEPFTVTYSAAATGLGEVAIEGTSRFVIPHSPDVTLHMRSAALEIAGECPPTQTPTVIPVIPTDTPMPATPEQTPDASNALIHLPVAYSNR